MMERVLSWTFALMLAAFLFAVGLQKFIGLDPNPVFGLIEARSGLGFFEPGLRYVTGVLEMAAVLLALWPATRIRGAQLGLVVATGAIGFHLSPWLGVQLPHLEELSAALAQGRTPDEIAAMNLPTDNGTMFILAVVIAATAVVSIIVERAKAKAERAPRVRRPMGALA